MRLFLFLKACSTRNANAKPNSSLSLISIVLVILTLDFSLRVQAAEKTFSDKPFIEVITSDAYSVSGIQSLQRQGLTVKVYNLDDGKRLVSTLSTNLPLNQEAAKKSLQQHFKKIGAAKVTTQFMQAFQAVTISTQYGLTRYPAVVFDHGQSVVYGQTNLTQALQVYRQWMAKQ